MKNPVINVAALLNMPQFVSKLSADTLQRLQNGDIVAVPKIYRFAKNLTGLSGIQELFSESTSKITGVTNIEKAKFDNDVILLGLGLEVAFGAADFNTNAALAAADFSNKILAPATFTDTDQTAPLISSLRASNGIRIPSAIRNGKFVYQVDGERIWEGIADDLFVDGAAAQEAVVNGDFSNFLSFTQTPRLITKDKLVMPTLDIPASVGNFHAVRVNHYVLELSRA